MKCPFCGHVYEEYEAASACSGCPFSGSCGKAKCPNCGYETPKEVGLVKLWNRWRNRRGNMGMGYDTGGRGLAFGISKGFGIGGGAELCPSAEDQYLGSCPIGDAGDETSCTAGEARLVPLTELNAEESGKICSLKADNPKRVQKLLALGVLPGLKLKVIQIYPVYVIQIGYTQIAIDNGIAGDIMVERE